MKQLSWFKKNRFPIILSMTIVMLMTVYFNMSSDSCTYVINGTIKVKSRYPGFKDEKIPLPELPVRVKGKSCSVCTWADWGETLTNEDGDFEVTEALSGNACDGRFVKAEVQFKDDEVRVRKSKFNSANWYKVGYRTDSQCDGDSDCEFGDLVFYSSGNYDRSDDDARAHADLWWVLKWTVNFFPNNYKIISNYDILDVIYPLNSLVVPDSVEASYVTPSTRLIHYYVDDDYDSLEYLEKTILHEIGHAWAFSRSENEELMQDYLFTNFNTHGVVEDPAVAFHEGFAKWFGSHLYRELMEDMGKDEELDESGNLLYQSSYNLAYSKTYLGAEQMSSAGKSRGQISGYDTECEHHGDGNIGCLDNGWFAILSGMTMGGRDDSFLSESGRDLVNYDTNVEDTTRSFIKNSYSGYDWSCHTERLELDFFDILDIFDSNEDFDTIHTDDMNITDFFYRVRQMKGIDKVAMDLYKDVWDMDNTDQPFSLFCEDSLFVTGIDGDPEYYWAYDYSSKSYTKTISVTVTNLSNGATPLLSYLRGPSSFIDHTKLTSNIDLSSLEQSTESFDVSVPVNENGSFPASTMTWKTMVLSSSDWSTNTKSITFGADYKADIYLVDEVPISEKKLDLSSGVKSMGFNSTSSKEAFRKNIKEVKGIDNILKDEDDETVFIDPIQTFYLYCGAINEGNISPKVSSTVGIYIDGELYDEQEVENISSGESDYAFFTVEHNSLNSLVSLDGSTQGLSVECKVDINDDIEEISESNNSEAEELIEAREADNNISEEIISDKEKEELRQVNDLIWDGLDENYDIQKFIEESLQYQNPHKYFGRLKDLEKIIYNIVAIDYIRGVGLKDSSLSVVNWQSEKIEYFSSDHFSLLVEKYLSGNLSSQKMEIAIKKAILK